jgi:hypothetical protein
MYNQLKKDNLEARKAKDTAKSNLLGTVIGDAQTIGKNAGNRDPNNEEVMGVIKKFIKALDESISALESSGRDNSKEKEERKILEAYLPAQLSNEKLKNEINKIVASLSEKSPKMMGSVMAELKDKFPNQFDGKIASTLVKQALG